MTISTTLLFSRAVDMMSRQQSDLAGLQEKVATGKELVRASDSPDLAVNISRMKSSIGQLDAFKNSLLAVNERLTIEEGYLEGSKDVLIRLKQLVIQGANGTFGARDREVIAIEVDELIAELTNLANGTDANGNFLFSGSRVSTMPYVEDENGVIRYRGDNFRPNVDYSSKRQSPIGRNGLDVFKPVLNGEFQPAHPATYELRVNGALEAGDTFRLEIDGHQFSETVSSGETKDSLLGKFTHQIRNAIQRGDLENIDIDSASEVIHLSAVDGIERSINWSAGNNEPGLADLNSVVDIQSPSEASVSFSGTPEVGDALVLTVGTRSFKYWIQGNEGGAQPISTEAVMRSLQRAATASGLFDGIANLSMTEDPLDAIQISAVGEKLGRISLDPIERTSVDDQSGSVNLISEPRPAIPERVEFFESLQMVSSALRHGSQEDIQDMLDPLDQMLDIVTLSMADIGAEMASIEREVSTNETIKLQLQAVLARTEDLDYASAITELQAKMMSLEAAQSSFARISQLSVFDYIR